MQLDENIQSYLYIAVFALAFFIVFFIIKDIYSFFVRRSSNTQSSHPNKEEIIEQQLKEDNAKKSAELFESTQEEPIKQESVVVEEKEATNSDKQQKSETLQEQTPHDPIVQESSPIIDSTRNIFEETAPKSDLEIAKEKLSANESSKSYRVDEQEHPAFSYEELVSELYRSRGYTISTHGIQDKKEIQLIAKKDREIYLMQCHKVESNSNKFINSKYLTNFMNQARDFVKNNKLYRHYDLSLICVVSEDIIDESGKKYVARKKNVYYEVVPL